MCATAANLIDYVLPEVALRQCIEPPAPVLASPRAADSTLSRRDRLECGQIGGCGAWFLPLYLHGLGFSSLRTGGIVTVATASYLLVQPIAG